MQAHAHAHVQACADIHTHTPSIHLSIHPYAVFTPMAIWMSGTDQEIKMYEVCYCRSVGGCGVLVVQTIVHKRYIQPLLKVCVSDINGLSDLPCSLLQRTTLASACYMLCQDFSKSRLTVAAVHSFSSLLFKVWPVSDFCRHSWKAAHFVLHSRITVISAIFFKTEHLGNWGVNSKDIYGSVHTQKLNKLLIQQNINIITCKMK